MQNYKIPTIEQCYELLKRHKTPDHIIRHCEAAASLAVEIAKKLSAQGTKVDIDFVQRGCLLHDVLRLTGKGHEDAAAEILKHEYPELALAIRKHAYLSIIDEEMNPRTIEEKIIYYADKRVMHDKVVSLIERLEEGHRRNTCPADRKTVDVDYIDSLIFELEKELLSEEE
jgi:HD superfamily phosphodiesterase